MTQSTSGMQVYETQQGYVDTWGVGGDRFSFLPKAMFAPRPFVGTTSPVPLALLSAPPTYAQLTTVAGQYGANGAAGKLAGSDPWNPQKSLVPWVIIGILIGLWGIHSLYYKKGKKIL